MVILGQEKEIEIRKDFRKEGTDHQKLKKNPLKNNLKQKYEKRYPPMDNEIR